jgi:hypothetical protein
MWTNNRLLWSFVGAGSFLVLWALILCARRPEFRVELGIFKTHYVQAIVQGLIYVYWGMTDATVFREVPLILFQLVFLYIFLALMSWSRGNSWRLGFGPMPIILSTNLLICFRHEWYILQFVMVSIGVLGKEFIKWTRHGKRTHIFNPSVFGQVVCAIFLISTGSTIDFTLGNEIAASFESVPHMIVLIFLLGVIVQYMFAVTLMTLAGASVLVLLNLIYFQITGTYYFVSINIGATIFLGLHLLVTDPSTSPRTHVGRVIFGGLYGVGYFVLFRILGDNDVPLFWDKLLPVPILNLSVKLFDRFAGFGTIKRLTTWWDSFLGARRLNLLHMACWGAIFVGLITTGFVDAPHPGESLNFWKQALDDDRPRAAEHLFDLVRHGVAHDDGRAWNMMGVLLLEGKIANPDGDVFHFDGLTLNRFQAAAHHFGRACELGYADGCINTATQVVYRGEARSPEAVQQAFDHIENSIEETADEVKGGRCFLLGSSYERGVGRVVDMDRARELYDQGCALGYSDACAALERINSAPPHAPDGN